MKFQKILPHLTDPLSIVAPKFLGGPWAWGWLFCGVEGCSMRKEVENPAVLMKDEIIKTII